MPRCTRSIADRRVRRGTPLRSRSARVIRAITVASVTAAALVLPTVGTAATPPTTDVTTRDGGRWIATGADGWRYAAPLTAPGAVMVGLAPGEGATAEVRGGSADAWGPWLPVSGDADAAAHDDHEHDAVTAPVWLGPSDRVQIRVRGPVAATPPDVSVVTARGGDGLAFTPGAPPASASATATPDFIVPRSEWDPNGECEPTDAPAHNDVVTAAYVHHTVVYPTYRPEEVDDILRAICAFHVEDRGYADIAYHFLVDRYGRTWEGRAGGVDRAIVGAHAKGYNTDSFGVAVIGDFEENPVPPAALDGVERTIAWAFALHGVDPTGTAYLRERGDELGAVERRPTIMGHRDTGSGTLCPGQHLYAALDGMPERVAARMEAAEPVEQRPETTPSWRRLLKRPLVPLWRAAEG